MLILVYLLHETNHMIERFYRTVELNRIGHIIHDHCFVRAGEQSCSVQYSAAESLQY